MTTEIQQDETELLFKHLKKQHHRHLWEAFTSGLMVGGAVAFLVIMLLTTLTSAVR